MNLKTASQPFQRDLTLFPHMETHSTPPRQNLAKEAFPTPKPILNPKQSPEIHGQLQPLISVNGLETAFRPLYSLHASDYQ